MRALNKIAAAVLLSSFASLTIAATADLTGYQFWLLTKNVGQQAQSTHLYSGVTLNCDAVPLTSTSNCTLQDSSLTSQTPVCKILNLTNKEVVVTKHINSSGLATYTCGVGGAS